MGWVCLCVLVHVIQDHTIVIQDRAMKTDHFQAHASGPKKFVETSLIPHPSKIGPQSKIHSKCVNHLASPASLQGSGGEVVGACLVVMCKHCTHRTRHIIMDAAHEHYCTLYSTN